MVVLGTIRLTCVLADYVGTFLESWRVQPITLQMLSAFAQDNQPIVVLAAAWPLLLCIALRQARWPELLPAAAATYLILSVGGMLELSAGLSQAQATGLTIGSFHLTRRVFFNPSLTDLALAVLGATQLLLELATAARALLLIPRCRGMQGAPAAKNEQARRARFGRLAVYVSIGFLVLVLRLSIWSTYVELLNKSSLIREFVLRNDLQRHGHRHHTLALTKDEKRLRDLRVLLMVANQAATSNGYQLAEENYRKLISIASSVPDDSRLDEESITLANALNGLAWLQVTCPDPGRRNPAQAVRHARRAIELLPSDGNIWNTLGVAYYRSREWEEAKGALSRSMDLRDLGDSFDWFFLALIEHKLGHRKPALEWYDKAVDWFRRSRPGDQELSRFHVEAADELGLPRPSPPPPSPPSTIRTLSPSLRPGSIWPTKRQHSSVADPLPRPQVP
jgi:tetratricopeptide (TPR) repeat protein